MLQIILIVFGLVCIALAPLPARRNASVARKAGPVLVIKPVPLFCWSSWREQVPFVFIHDSLPLVGDLYAFGVSGGESMLQLRKMLPGVRMWGFDSFKGMPSDTTDDVQQIDFEAGKFKGPKTPADLVADLGGPKKAAFIVGFFNKSLSPSLWNSKGMKPAMFVDIDTDLYSSTLEALDWAFRSGAIRPGTVIGYDDWWVNPCSQGGEHLSPLATGEGRAHVEIVWKYRVRCRCLAGSCKLSLPASECVVAWGPIFVIEAIGSEDIPWHGFEMSHDEIQTWKNVNEMCSRHRSSLRHRIVPAPFKG